MNIDQATLADRETIFGLHVDSVTHLCASHYTQSEVGGWFIGRTPENYTGAIEYGGVWIARQGIEPVGFTEVFPGLISMMFVRTASAGQGVGKQLMDFALEQAKYGAPPVIKLEATLNAQTFYERYSFRKVGDSYLVREGSLKLPTVMMERTEPG